MMTKTFFTAKDFHRYGRVCYLVGHLGRAAGCADARIIPIYTLNAASTAAAPPGTTWGYGPQPQSSWGCGPQPQNGSPHTTSRTRGTRKVDLMTDAAIRTKALRDSRIRATAVLAAARVPPHRPLPRSYIRCLEDRAKPVSASLGVIRRLGVDPLTMGGSHSPFLSRPRELAALLVRAPATTPTGPPHPGSG